METLKKFFPFSFGAKDVAALVIKIIIYVVADVIIGVAAGLLGMIPVAGAILGPILWVITSLVGVYVVGGIVIAILDYCKVLK